MDNIKSDSSNWKPKTRGGPRPGSGRPTLGGEEDPTVTVTVMMPLSLKLVAVEIGDGNMSRGIREAIALTALSRTGKPSFTTTPQLYGVTDVRPRSLPQPVGE